MAITNNKAVQIVDFSQTQAQNMANGVKDPRSTIFTNHS